MSNIDFNYLQTISNLILHDIDQLVRWHVHFNVENPEFPSYSMGEKICLLVKWSAKTLIISADIDNSMEPIGYPSKENDLFFDRMREHNFQIGVDGVTPFEKAIWKEIDFFAPNDADWKKSVQWILQQVNNNIQQKYSHSGISFTISTPPSSGGCYIATAVYGSYDCPQVWTLRRFRDFKLAKSLGGRIFIKLYYAISPTLVRWFGKTTWFNHLWRRRLDKMVERLHKNGYADTPYNGK